MPFVSQCRAESCVASSTRCARVMMMIMMVASVARHAILTEAGATAAKILRNFPYLTSSGLPRRTFDTLETRVGMVLKIVATGM